MTRAQSGDREAFHEIYLAHHAALYRFAWSETGSEDDARDVVQETFIRAWGALGSFRGESSLLHWLFRIARNLVIDRARARKRRGEVSLDAPLNDEGSTLADRVPARQAGPAESAEREQERARFHAAIAALSADHRAVFLLREWEGMPYEGIAVRLGINLGTVRSRLARAREALLAGMGGAGAP